MAVRWSQLFTPSQESIHQIYNYLPCQTPRDRIRTCRIAKDARSAFQRWHSPHENMNILCTKYNHIYNISWYIYIYIYGHFFINRRPSSNLTLWGKRLRALQHRRNSVGNIWANTGFGKNILEHFLRNRHHCIFDGSKRILFSFDFGLTPSLPLSRGVGGFSIYSSFLFFRT